MPGEATTPAGLHKSQGLRVEWGRLAATSNGKGQDGGWVMLGWVEATTSMYNICGWEWTGLHSPLVSVKARTRGSLSIDVGWVWGCVRSG